MLHLNDPPYSRPLQPMFGLWPTLSEALINILVKTVNFSYMPVCNE